MAAPPLNGFVVRRRPISVLKTGDEAGEDTKLLAVPIDRLRPLYGA
jgi:inorganic pyrophosphatase